MARTIERDLIKCVEIAVATSVVGMQSFAAIVIGLIATI